MRKIGLNQSKQLTFSRKSIQYQRLQTYKIIIIIVLSFLLFIPFPWQEAKMLTRQFKVQLGKSTLIILSTKEKCPFWREKNTSPSIFSFIDHVFSISRPKKYGSEIDIKVVIPEPTQYTTIYTKDQTSFP